MMEDGNVYSVMISSSVNCYEDQLLRIEAEFKGLGYAVVMSMSGTMRVDPIVESHHGIYDGASVGKIARIGGSDREKLSFCEKVYANPKGGRTY